VTDRWIVPLTVIPGTAARGAELNLTRIFVRDWRKGRREQSTKARAPRVRRRAARRRPPLRARAGIAAAALPIGAAVAQPATLQGPPEFALDQHRLSLAIQPTAGAEGAAPATKSPFSLQLNLDYVTAYFYHGIIQEDTGLILQPAARLTVNLYEQDDFKIDALLGVWNSFHGQKTGANTRGDFSDYWYEADLIGGFVITKNKLSLTTTYTFLTSPSDAYETVQELDLTLAYDDGDLLGRFALHPYALLGVETGADASDGADSDTGTYLELSIAPGFSFDMGRTPVSITFPASIGLSLKDYYQDAAGDDDTFGFAQLGVKASLPLPFGDRYGKWTLNAGLSALLLGDNTARYNGDDDRQVIATIGLQANF
jgi:hypothetical protein